MGVKTAGRWCRQLIDHGKPPQTPVAIVRWCSLARQQTLRCTLGTVIQTVEQQGLESPALFIVGKAVDRAPPVTWFDARPDKDAK